MTESNTIQFLLISIWRSPSAWSVFCLSSVFSWRRCHDFERTFPNEVWRYQHPNKFFGRSCKSPDPPTYVTQQFGREVCFTNSNSSSGLAAISLLGCGPMPKSSPTTSIDDTLTKQPLVHTLRLFVG
jgi:hypothetical protein